MALLYVLDSVLKSGKAREAKLNDKDPGIAKSMQRFCNAVAAGLPALLRATQSDPACYDKTLRVSQPITLEPYQDGSMSSLCSGHHNYLSMHPFMRRPQMTVLGAGDARLYDPCCLP